MKSSEIKVHFETCFVLPNSEQKNNVFSASASGKMSRGVNKYGILNWHSIVYITLHNAKQGDLYYWLIQYLETLNVLVFWQCQG